jgi:hypothetical protein
MGIKIGLNFRDDQSVKQTRYSQSTDQNIKCYYELFEVMGHELFMLEIKNWD